MLCLSLMTEQLSDPNPYPGSPCNLSKWSSSLVVFPPSEFESLLVFLFLSNNEKKMNRGSTVMGKSLTSQYEERRFLQRTSFSAIFPTLNFARKKSALRIKFPKTVNRLIGFQLK